MSDFTTVGFLHPGAMGASIAKAATTQGVWASADRSPETRRRATDAGLDDVGSLQHLAEQSDVVVSVCPPGEALTVAAAVAATGFDGIYVDANAVAPHTARAIGQHHRRFVDGGIIGPPAHAPGTTRLYLNGTDAADVASIWAASNLEVRLVEGDIGAASAVKMCFAAWTKGSAALLLAVNALAEHEGVRSDLLAEWATSLPDLSTRSETTASGTGPKAWRFAGEMDEIAETFDLAQLPDGFHRAAADLYRRMAGFKGREDGPGIHEVTSALLHD